MAGFYQLCNGDIIALDERLGTIRGVMLPQGRVFIIVGLGMLLVGGCSPSGASSGIPGPAASGALELHLGSRSRVAEAALPVSTTIPPGGLTPEAEVSADAKASAPSAGNLAVPRLNPLTGLSVPDARLLDRRPLAIKISNYPRDIRPQYGLNEADVVFEYYIEWGYTRFIGIFYGNDARQIGPVRSGRYFDEHITRMYHAYYVFNYADPREYDYFLGGDLQPFMVVPGYGSCPPFFQVRVSGLISDVRHYETFFDSSRFADCLARKSGDNERPRLDATTFSRAVPTEGIQVDRMYTYYSRCDYSYWQYDTSLGRYLRFQEASPNQKLSHINDCSDKPQTYASLTDAATGKQVSADNVVVLYAAHTFANVGEQDDEIYHINLLDSGRAYIFRDGIGLPARWVRTDIDQPLLITTPAGRPLGLRPGRTFFEVIGETSSEWSDNAAWHFDFRTP